MTPEQVILSTEANMSNTQVHDTRVDMGYCDLKLRGRETTQYGADENQNFLDSICGRVANCNLHSRGCWGLYVIRTCFAQGDDERVAQAMAKLDTIFAMNIKESRSYSEPLNPTHTAVDAEIMRRFHNVLINDAQLQDASISEIRSYLESWFALTPQPRRGPRFQTFILLDSQVLANLDQLPDKFALEEWSNLYLTKSYEWVKLVDVDEDWDQCRVWIWHLVNLLGVLNYRDHGVSDLAVEEARDGFEWPFYCPV